MFNIALSLLGGLILSWFGFESVVHTGMYEVFGKEISSIGYYFLFGLIGALRSIAVCVRNYKNLNLNKNDK